MGGQLQMPIQGAGDYAYLTSDFINIGGQTIQLQLPGGLQLPISMLSSGQLVANGIQLLESADVQQTQPLLAGSEERQDDLTSGADLLADSQQDAKEDIVNPATVLLQLATEKASARANKVGIYFQVQPSLPKYNLSCSCYVTDERWCVNMNWLTS